MYYDYLGYGIWGILGYLQLSIYSLNMYIITMRLFIQQKHSKWYNCDKIPPLIIFTHPSGSWLQFTTNRYKYSPPYYDINRNGSIIGFSGFM